MDSIEYWVYAIGQAIIAVTYLKMREKNLNMAALVLCAILAPIITCGAAYVVLDYLLNWLKTDTHPRVN